MITGSPSEQERPAPAPYRQARAVNKGRIVIYRALDPSGAIYERPAIITRVWSDDMLQLAVFYDGGNDADKRMLGIDGGMGGWATSVHYSSAPAPHTWCWCDEQDLSPEGQAR